MLEVSTDTRTRDAIRAAHRARGDALRQFWRRVRRYRSSG